MILCKTSLALVPYAVILMLLTGCGIASAAAGPKIEVTAYSEKSIKLEQPSSLDFACDSSNIEVYTWEKSEVKFEMTKRIRGAQARNKLEEKLKDLSVDIKQSGNRVIYKSSCRGKVKRPADKSVDLKVYVPKKVLSINLKADIGYIKFYDDVKCSLDADVNMVNIDMNRFEGSISLKADMCSLRIDNGKLKGLSSVKVNMGNISIKSDYEENGKYSLETGIGNIELLSPAGAHVNMEAIGPLEINEFESPPYPTKISIKTGMGKISVKKY